MLADTGEWEYMMIGTRYCKSLLHLILYSIVRRKIPRCDIHEKRRKFSRKRAKIFFTFSFFLDVSAHA